MLSLLKSVVFLNLALTAFSVTLAQAPAPSFANCGTPARTTCSFTAMNSDCILGIDRLRPVTPPTINVRRGSNINLKITNASVFEKLSLGLKSASAQAPTDLWQTAFTALSPNMQRFTLATIGETSKGPSRGPSKKEIETTEKKQNALLAALQGAYSDTANNSAIAFALIKPATQAPPADVCSIPDDPASPWFHTDAWRNKVDTALNDALKSCLPDMDCSSDTTAAQEQITEISAQISALTNAPPSDIENLNANQKVLKDTLTSLTTARSKLQKLKVVIDALPTQSNNPNNMKIIDLHARRDGSGKLIVDDSNSLNEQWTLSFVNTLLPAVVAALSDPTDPFISSVADLKATPPQKTDLMTITALYQTPPHIEFSAGFLVPVRPFHSYASAAQASGGSVTDYIVQETLTYIVIPAAEMNFVIHDWKVRGQSTGFFGTVAVGYNSTSSAVEFGVGPSFSWKSMLINGLADFGRDTELGGGFQVGQSLGTSGSTKPLTSTVWKVKPAVGFSVRIPLSSK